MRAIIISDRFVAVVGIVLCLALVVPLFMIGSMVMFLLPAVLTTALCLIWMLVRRSNYHVEERMSSKNAFLVCAGMFFLLLTVAIVTLYYREDTYERPDLFFLTVSLMAGVLATEIMFSEERQSPFVLAQTFVLAILLTWSILVLFPNVVGVDPWWHRMFTFQIIDTGFVPERYGYTGIPLFHIFNGASAIIGGIDYKLASMLMMMVGQLASEVLLVFAIGRQAFRSHRIGLMAAVVAVFSGLSIHMSYEPTPTTLAFIFVLLALFLVLREDRGSLKVAGLVIFLSLIVVLTHTVTAVCLLLTFVIGAVVVRVRWTAPPIPVRFASLTLIAYVMVTMLGWWFYASGLLPPFQDLLELGFNRDFFGTGTLPVPTVPAFETTMKWAGMMMLFSISIIGVLHSISKRGNLRAVYVSAAGMVFLTLGIVALTLHLGLLEDRWWFYAQLVLAIPIGAAIIFLGNGIRRRTRVRAAQVVVTIGVASLALISIISPVANIDNPLIFPNSSIRYAYTSSEMNGASYAASRFDGLIASDSDFTTNPSSSVFIDHFMVDSDRLVSIDENIIDGNFSKDGTVKVVRTVVYERALRLTGQVYRLDYDMNGMLAASDLDRVYSNGGVDIYI